MNEVGRARRLKRLYARGPVNLVALDHGITMGWTPTQDAPREVARSCVENGLSGIICHFGLLPEILTINPAEVFMQVHASTRGDARKEVICNPEIALQADCVGIAVEYQSSGDSAGLARSAETIQRARSLGLLVLVMANYVGEDYFSANLAAAGAQQLAPDFIKLRLPSETPEVSDLKQLGRIIANGPPYLVAGGESTSNLQQTLSRARDFGMEGSCIGRHYFDAQARPDAVRRVLQTFLDDER